MKIVVFGSRKFGDRLAVHRELSKLPSGTIVVHGGAPGADSLAGEVAKKLGFEVRVYMADWSVGRSGGPIRNRTLLAAEHPDKNGIPIQFGLAFSAFFTKEFAPGTFDMESLCTARGIKVTRYSE